MMKALGVVMVLVAGCGGVGVEGEIDSADQELSKPLSGFGCQATILPGDVASGEMAFRVSFYTKPGCAGTYVGTDELHLYPKNQPAVKRQLALEPKLASASRYAGVTLKAGMNGSPSPSFRRACPDGGQWNFPYLQFDNYSGGRFECTYGVGSDPNACARFPSAIGCRGHGGSGGGDVCGTWDRIKCATAIGISASTPGLRELVAAIWTGNVQAALTVLGWLGAGYALQAIGLIPGMDGCACIAGSIIGGCSRNMDQLARYLLDAAQGRASWICSY
jgi:hypothetical protein